MQTMKYLYWFLSLFAMSVILGCSDGLQNVKTNMRAFPSPDHRYVVQMNEHQYAMRHFWESSPGPLVVHTTVYIRESEPSGTSHHLGQLLLSANCPMDKLSVEWESASKLRLSNSNCPIFPKGITVEYDGE